MPWKKGLKHRLSGRRRSTKPRMKVVREEVKTKVKLPPFLELERTIEKKPSRNSKASDRAKRKAKKARD